MPTRKAIERPRQTQQERPIADRVRLRYLSEMSEKQGAKNDPPNVLVAWLDRGRLSKETEINPEKAKETSARVKAVETFCVASTAFNFAPQAATNRLWQFYSVTSNKTANILFARHRAKFCAELLFFKYVLQFAIHCCTIFLKGG